MIDSKENYKFDLGVKGLKLNHLVSDHMLMTIIIAIDSTP